MTHPRGSEASAPGKTYLFMLELAAGQVFMSLERDNSQQAPVEVLELPVGSDTGDLEDHKTVIGKQVVHLAEEGAVSSDTDVLGHFETGDLVEVALLVRDLSVVLAEDSALRLGHAVLSQSLGSESGLLLGKSDWSENEDCGGAMTTHLP
jgi:hypothetical protein